MAITLKEVTDLVTEMNVKIAMLELQNRQQANMIVEKDHHLKELNEVIAKYMKSQSESKE